jgi:hypothetical protein
MRISVQNKPGIQHIFPTHHSDPSESKNLHEIDGLGNQQFSSESKRLLSGQHPVTSVMDGLVKNSKL